MSEEYIPFKDFLIKVQSNRRKKGLESITEERAKQLYENIKQALINGLQIIKDKE